MNIYQIFVAKTFGIAYVINAQLSLILLLSGAKIQLLVFVPIFQMTWRYCLLDDNDGQWQCSYWKVWIMPPLCCYLAFLCCGLLNSYNWTCFYPLKNLNMCLMNYNLSFPYWISKICYNIMANNFELYLLILYLVLFLSSNFTQINIVYMYTELYIIIFFILEFILIKSCCWLPVYVLMKHLSALLHVLDV